MIREYVFISSQMNGSDVTAISIMATDMKEALIKAYSYFGGDSRLKISEFNILCKHSEIGRVYQIFKEFTGQTILYFAEKIDNEEQCFVDNLYTVDIIRCQ